MASRLDLSEEFHRILKSENVYFQPPSSIKMSYPAIAYSIGGLDKRNANDKMYKSVRKYEGMVIDYNPDSEIPTKLVEEFPMCSLGKSFIADNLNHFPFTLYF